MRKMITFLLILSFMSLISGQEATNIRRFDCLTKCDSMRIRSIAEGMAKQNTSPLLYGIAGSCVQGISMITFLQYLGKGQDIFPILTVSSLIIYLITTLMVYFQTRRESINLTKRQNYIAEEMQKHFQVIYLNKTNYIRQLYYFVGSISGAVIFFLILFITIGNI